MALLALWAFEYAFMRDDVDQLPQNFQEEIFTALALDTSWADEWKITVTIGACEAWRASVAAASGLPPPQSARATAAAAAAAATTTAATAAATAQSKLVFDSALQAGIAAALVGKEAGLAGRLQPPQLEQSELEATSIPWWHAPAPPTAGRPVAVETTTVAHHNILAPFTCSPPGMPGASNWNELTVNSGSLLHWVVQDGLSPCTGNLVATATERLELTALLARAVLLYVDPEQLISSEEITRLRLSRKSEDPKRRTACPSLAGFPWLQRLALEPSGTRDPRDLGRRVAVAFRLHTAKQSTFSINNFLREAIVKENESLLKKILSEIQSASIAQMYLAIGEYQAHVMRRAREAYADARAAQIRWPRCQQLLEMSAGRHQQMVQLPSMWADLTALFTTASNAHPGHEERCLLGSWALFFEGTQAPGTADTSADAAIMLRGGMALGSGGGHGAATGIAQPPPGTSGGAAKASAGTGGAVSGVASSGGTKSASGAGTGQAANPAAMMYRVHCPFSETIVGNSIGRRPAAGPCWTCNVVGPGHYKGECPVALGRDNRPLPGWTINGIKKLSEWTPNKQELRRMTYTKWIKFLTDKANFPNKQFIHPAPARGQPDIFFLRQNALFLKSPT